MYVITTINLLELPDIIDILPYVSLIQHIQKPYKDL